MKHLIWGRFWRFDWLDLESENFGMNIYVFNSLSRMNGNLHPLIFWKPTIKNLYSSRQTTPLINGTLSIDFYSHFCPANDMKFGGIYLTARQ